ncbi:MAG: KpsF/GutQ family sugar-phosphate isomerase [Proteobacteria bacterium]|nr:KpsF/GutQ family sugar-phosphate isomerase [Pseudomonadota bacterium]
MTTLVALQDKAVIASGRDVLEKEAAALNALASQLDGAFERAVSLLMSVTGKGRVIVTGMGKSGHIGAKIAATMASTGTPAYFVHPGEASHGDLGMVTADDAVLAISHSGGTKELGDMIAHCKRFSVPLVCIVGKADSVLGRAADVCLSTGVTEEACPLNLAPTTSTTATLALGDALAVALMTLRGFRKEDFAGFHPGGGLGSRLARVADLMAQNDDLPLVSESATMQEAILEMTAKRLGLVGVADKGGVLAGIVTDGDLRRHMSPELLSRTVGEIMTKAPSTIQGDQLAASAVQMMQARKITALFVVDEMHRPQGVLHIHHCLQAGVI